MKLNKGENAVGISENTWEDETLGLFRQGKWQEYVNALQKDLDTTQPDQKSLAYSGVSYVRLGEHDRAISAFEKLRSPIPPVAALNWASVLTHKHEYTKALQILSRINSSIRAKASKEEVQEVFACLLFEDILSFLTGQKTLGSLKLKRRGRLLKLASLGILPFSYMLRSSGRVFNRLGYQGGESISGLAENIRQFCWSQGLPIQPGFVNGYIRTEELKYYEDSIEVFRNIFFSYLDYWIYSEVDIASFLVTCVKPGDANALYSIIREKQPSVVLEIGAFIGVSTSIIARALKDNNKGTIHSVDPNIEFFSTNSPLLHARKMLKTFRLDSYVQFHEGFFSEPRNTYNSDSPVLGRTISEVVPPVDLAFIDGDHELTAVLQDFMLLLPVLKPNATVIFHDIKSWPRIRQAIATILNDDIWKKQMKYFELLPSGYDGLGIIEFQKKE